MSCVSFQQRFHFWLLTQSPLPRLQWLLQGWTWVHEKFLLPSLSTMPLEPVLASGTSKRVKRADTPRVPKSNVVEEAGGLQLGAGEKQVALKDVTKLLKAAGRGAGLGVAEVAAGRPVTRRRDKRCAALRWLLPSPTQRRSMFFWLMMAAVFSTWRNPDWMQGLSQTSAALGEVSAAASELVGASANATVAVTNLGVLALSTATTAVDEFVRGVDLVNVSLNRHSVRVFGNSQQDVAQWVLMKSPFPDFIRQWFGLRVTDVTSAVRMIEDDEEFVNVNGTYWRLWSRTRSRCDGSLVQAMVALTADFEPQWANPFWDWCGFPANSQAQQILMELRSCVKRFESLPNEIFAVDDSFLAKAFGVKPSWCFSFRQKVVVWAMALITLGGCAAGWTIRYPDRWNQLRGILALAWKRAVAWCKTPRQEDLAEPERAVDDFVTVQSQSGASSSAQTST